ncbi:MAG: histidine--tRNA ligase [Anaerolineae bacterium]|jgi:histidyl-tRNA synthetase|nr:histidine--tRNA ligase [Anaerolineae bacterium]
MTQVIKPTPISGFPEFLPAQQIVFNRMLNIVRTTFERYGFSPIETPAVERKEILTSKGGNEKEIYALSRLAAEEGENAETDLALHFDLTVPLARYVALHKDKLVFPFRRYQIQKVWRGERAQAGRSREFYQCDIDVIGRGSVSILNDAEIPSIIYAIFREMGIGPFVIRINNRKILQGYFASLAVPSDRIADVIRIVDKLEKIGGAKVVAELVKTCELSEETANTILTFLGEAIDTDSVLAKLATIQKANDLLQTGVEELRVVIDGIRAFGVPEDYFKIDLTIARGLEYYTGTVYETQLRSHPEIGSICSGGRYDDLASFFTNEKLPGIGISIGLTRLISVLMEAGLIQVDSATTAQVLVTTMDESRKTDYLRIGALLREAGIATEVYLEKGRLGDQLKYANKKGFPFAVIAGGDEFDRHTVKLKNLVSGEEREIPLTELAAHLHAKG